jgi:restriction system protein
MTPTQFEHFCAEQLRQARWGPRVTTRNEDQGVDVIAEKNDVDVVVQCKLYGRAFGNDASSKSIYGLCQLDSGKGLNWICHMLSSKYRKGLRVLGYPDEIGSAAT